LSQEKTGQNSIARSSEYLDSCIVGCYPHITIRHWQRLLPNLEWFLECYIVFVIELWGQW
jgi:hypothetical protein